MLPIKPQTTMSQAVSSSIITEVKPSLNAVRKFVLSEKIKHIKVAKIKASKMRFVIKIYPIKKTAGISANSPISMLSSTKSTFGKNKVISNVNPATKKTEIQNLKTLLKASDFVLNNNPFFSNAVSKQKN